MLLLDPGDGLPSPTVWTVVSGRTLICYREGVRAEAKLTKNGLPKDWLVIENRSLARHLNQLAGHDRVFPTGQILKEAPDGD